MAGFSPEEARGGSPTIKDGGSTVGTRQGVNFIEGANVTITVTDDPTNDEVDVTIAASVTGASGVDISEEGGSASTVTSIDFVGSMTTASVVGPVGTVTTAHGTQAGGSTHPDAVAAGASGFMSGADKTKLDGIASGATNGITTQDEGSPQGVNQTTLNFVGSGVSAASVGAVTTVTIAGGGGGGSGDVVGPGSATDNAVARFDTTTGKLLQNSAVTIDDSGNISTAGTVDGRDVSVDGTKLDGIEAGADVTDAANVAAAGALMSGASAGGDLTGTYPNPTIASTTGSGAFVRATSPTLVTPVLGAASATSLALTTDLAVTDGGTGASNASGARTNLGLVIGTDVAAASHTHAAADITSGVIDPARLGSGSGGSSKFLREDSTFQTIPGGGDALTSGNLSQFASTTSSQLAGVISDETGSGALVFGTSPTLTTPTLGVASATSINKVAITAPTTSATLTIADGATLTVSASATVSGTNTGDQTNISGNAATVTTNANLTGPVTSVGNATSITDAAVTLAKMANLAQDQFIGRVTASTGVPETATITAAARSVLDDSTVADMVNTLGGATSTGSGGLARATSPTFTTPTLGAASATSLTLSTDLAVADGGTGASTAAAARTNLGIAGIPVGATFGDGDDTASVVAGQVAYVRCGFAGTITRWDIVADVAISAVFDIWKDTTLPTSADSIVASADPSLTTATTGGSTTLTGWTTSVSVGDILAFELTTLSSGTPKQITISIMVA